MSLSREPTLTWLRNRFVCGFRDITGEPFAGVSGHHGPEEAAIIPRNGAGPHNLQMFVLEPDGTVLHCVTGYWNSNDLAVEFMLAEQLDQVYRNRALTPKQKTDSFRQMQMAHVAQHPVDMVARSLMNRFDMRYEAKYRGMASDTLRPGVTIVDGTLDPNWFRTTDQLIHIRMAARPFVPYASFDTDAFCDYGAPFYDIDTVR